MYPWYNLLKAPPETGKANAAVIELLSFQLKTDKRKIEVIHGHFSSVKVLEIKSLTDENRLAAIHQIIT